MLIGLLAAVSVTVTFFVVFAVVAVIFATLVMRSARLREKSDRDAWIQSRRAESSDGPKSPSS